MKKHFFKRGVGFVLLALLVVACGAEKKSNGGGGSTSNMSSYSPNASYSQGNQQMQQVLTNFSSWYTSNNESMTYTNYGTTMPIVKLVYPLSTTNTNSNCQTQSFLGLQFQLCGSMGSNNNNVNPISSTQQIINLIQNGHSKNQGRMAGFDLATGKTPYGQIVNATQSGSVFQFLTLRNGVYDTVVIDASYNSAVNPIAITNRAQGQVEVIRW